MYAISRNHPRGGNKALSTRSCSRAWSWRPESQPRSIKTPSAKSKALVSDEQVPVIYRFDVVQSLSFRLRYCRRPCTTCHDVYNLQPFCNPQNSNVVSSRSALETGWFVVTGQHVRHHDRNATNVLIAMWKNLASKRQSQSSDFNAGSNSYMEGQLHPLVFVFGLLPRFCITCNARSLDCSVSRTPGHRQKYWLPSFQHSGCPFLSHFAIPINGR